MKKLLFITALIFTGCGTSHRVVNKTERHLDSVANVKTDTSNVSKLDSTGSKQDHSLVITTEHVVSDVSRPGDTITAKVPIGLLMGGHNMIFRGKTDSSGTLLLVFDKGDTTLTAVAINSAYRHIITTDRVVTDHSDVKQESNVKKSDSVNIAKDSRIKTHVDLAVKNTDTVKTGAEMPWYAWTGIIIGVFLLLAGISAYILHKNNL